MTARVKAMGSSSSTFWGDGFLHTARSEWMMCRRWSHMHKWLATLSFTCHAHWCPYDVMWRSTAQVMKKKKLPFGKTVFSFVRQMNCHVSRMTSGYLKLQETTFEHAKCEHVTEPNLQEPVVGSFLQCTIQSSCLKKSCSRVKMKTKKLPLCAQGG